MFAGTAIAELAFGSASRQILTYEPKDRRTPRATIPHAGCATRFVPLLPPLSPTTETPLWLQVLPASLQLLRSPLLQGGTLEQVRLAFLVRVPLPLPCLFLASQRGCYLSLCLGRLDLEALHCSFPTHPTASAPQINSFLTALSATSAPGSCA
jgi:hypothetical protein